MNVSKKPIMVSEVVALANREGRELAALRLFRRLDPEGKQAMLRHAELLADGMPPEDAARLAWMEIGLSEDEAAANVAQTMAQPRRSWRELLD